MTVGELTAVEVSTVGGERGEQGKGLNSNPRRRRGSPAVWSGPPACLIPCVWYTKSRDRTQIATPRPTQDPSSSTVNEPIAVRAPEPASEQPSSPVASSLDSQELDKQSPGRYSPAA